MDLVFVEGFYLERLRFWSEIEEAYGFAFGALQGSWFLDPDFDTDAETLLDGFL